MKKRIIYLAIGLLIIIGGIALIALSSQNRQSTATQISNFQNNQPPLIEKIIYKDKVRKGEIQEIIIKIIEENPSDFAILNLNKTILQIPLSYINKTSYSLSFDPSAISQKEGYLVGNLTLIDKFKNKVSIPISFLANLQEPLIENITIEKINLGEYKVKAIIYDDNLASAWIEINGAQIPLVKSDSFYEALINTTSDLKGLVKAIDTFNQISSSPFKINLVDRDKFELSLPQKYKNSLSLELYDSSALFQEIYSKKGLDGVLPILQVANTNPEPLPKNLAYQILDQIQRDNNINPEDKINVAIEASDAILDLGLANKDLDLVSLYYILNLTSYERSNPVNTFGKENLLKVIDLTQNSPIIYLGLSGKEPIEGEESEILTYIVLDNYSASKEFPYAAWAYAKQGYATLIWLNLNSWNEVYEFENSGKFVKHFDYTTPLEFNGTKVSLRDIVDKSFQIQYEFAKRGELLIGLKPEDILNLLPDNMENKLEFADQLMRLKVLPQALFLIDWPNARYIWEKYPGVMNPGSVNDNGPAQPLIPVIHPEQVLYQAMINLNYANTAHDSALKILKNPDMPLYKGVSALTFATTYFGTNHALFSEYWPNTIKETSQDVRLLLEKGSDISKAQLLLYGKGIADANLSTNPGSREEERVEQAIANFWSVGIPGTRMEIGYPDNSDRSRWVHGEPSLFLPKQDIQLLYNRSQDELASYGSFVHMLGIRKPALIKDNSPKALIFLPDYTMFVYYKKK